MPALQFSGSIEDGFNFHKDSQETIGHLLELKVGEKKFTADLEVLDPTDIANEKLVKVVGVISGIDWAGGFTQPVGLHCQVGDDNAKDAAIQTHKDLTNTDVEFKFVVYQYDPYDKKYYTCFHSGEDTLKGLVEKNGGALSYEVEITQPSPMVQSPINYGLYLSIVPQEIAQKLYMAVGEKHKLVKKWGVSTKA